MLLQNGISDGMWQRHDKNSFCAPKSLSRSCFSIPLGACCCHVVGGICRFVSGMSVVVPRLSTYAHCFSEFEARQLHQEMATKFSITWASPFFSTLYHYSFKSLWGPKGQANSNRFRAGMHCVDIAKCPLPKGMSNNVQQHSLKQHLFV